MFPAFEHVPAYPLATLPKASNAVTEIKNGVPATPVVGADTA